jgi:hypothetical protein
VSSRLERDAGGRPVRAVITATVDASQRVGEIFVVLGNDLPVNAPGFRMLGSRTGRRIDAVDVVQHGRPRLPDAAKRGTIREQTSRNAPV